MPDPNDPTSYGSNEDDWTVDPNSGVDADGNAVSRDPNAPDEDIPLNPYDAALIGPQQPVDADGLPTSTPYTPDNPAPASSEPMEDGLEEDDPPEDEPEGEEEPPIQQRVARQQIKLPGAKGPLEVDSVGDYLEDADWTQVDEAARSKANAARANQEAERASRQQEEQSKLEQRKVASDNRKAAKADRRNRRSESAVDDAGSVRSDVPSIEGMTLSEVTGDTEPVEDNEYYSTTAQDSIVPVGPPASPKHLQSQKDFNYDFGSQGPSSFDIPGQASTAKEDAVDKAADSINTATGRIVDMLEGLAQVMNNHSNRIAQLEDTLDMESERDVG